MKDTISDLISNNKLDKSSNNIQQNESKNKMKNLKRGKYIKTNNKSEFLKNIHYLEIKEGTKTWKYSLSKYNDKSNSGYYYYSDTNCKGKGTYTFNQTNITEYEKKN